MKAERKGGVVAQGDSPYESPEGHNILDLEFGALPSFFSRFTTFLPCTAALRAALQPRSSLGAVPCPAEPSMRRSLPISCHRTLALTASSRTNLAALISLFCLFGPRRRRRLQVRRGAGVGGVHRGHDRVRGRGGGARLAAGHGAVGSSGSHLLVSALFWLTQAGYLYCCVVFRRTGSTRGQRTSRCASVMCRAFCAPPLYRLSCCARRLIENQIAATQVVAAPGAEVPKLVFPFGEVRTTFFLPRPSRLRLCCRWRPRGCLVSKPVTSSACRMVRLASGGACITSACSPSPSAGNVGCRSADGAAGGHLRRKR